MKCPVCESEKVLDTGIKQYVRGYLKIICGNCGVSRYDIKHRNPEYANSGTVTTSVGGNTTGIHIGIG